jgi:RNA polymerase II transcription factor SIII (Elongin) subunit A
MDPLPQQPQDDFPSLLSIVQAAIKHKYISFLGDLGSIDVFLLGDVLAACSPEELKHIEESTLNGVCKGRDLSGYTWPLWYTHCINNDSHRFFTSLKTLPPLPPPTGGSHPSQTLGLLLPANVAPANYRLVYENIMKHREEKLAQTGKRLKEMRTKQEREKASRSIQVRNFWAFESLVAEILL